MMSNNNSNIPGLFNHVQTYLVTHLPAHKGSGENTIKSYREALRQYLEFLRLQNAVRFQDLHFGLITRDSLENYLDWVENDNGNCVTTRNQRLYSIRAFITYAASRDLRLQALSLELAKIKKKNSEKTSGIKYFGEEVLELLLKQPVVTTKNGYRDRTFMILLYDLGARIQEMIDLRICDVHLDPKAPFVTVTGKGQKIRNVPIMDKTTEHLTRYFAKFHPNPSDDDPLFFVIHMNQIQPLSQDAISKFLEKYRVSAEKADEIPMPTHLSAHMFRHSRAMHLYQGGTPLALIGEWLGHADLATTLIYAHADTQMKRKAIEMATSEFNPLRTARYIISDADEEEFKRMYGLV